MELYLISSSKSEFFQELKINFNKSIRQGEILFTEISDFFNTVNLSPSEQLENSKKPQFPNFEIAELYALGKTIIKLHFGSEWIKALIHPQWVHASSLDEENNCMDFHVFKEKDFLYLYKNEIYVDHYNASDYHLLQGKFSLQIVNTLYDKIESDWIATFHASTVCNHREAIMLIGDSGNGKSTLSAILMANGIDVLTDDFTPLAAGNKNLYRFPSGISVKPGAFEMLRPLFADFDNFPVFKSTSKNVNVKYIPPIKSIGEGPSHVPCKKIIHVKFNKTTTSSSIERIGIEKILEILIPDSWISPLAQNSKLFLEWIKDLECLELNYSDNEFAVTSIKKLFDS